MNKLKLIFLIIIIVLIIISIIIGIILMGAKKEEQEVIEELNYTEEIEQPVDIRKLDNYNYYFSILDKITTYYRYVAEQDSEGIYSLLDKEYTKNNGIDKNNILNKISNDYNKNCSYKIREIYTQDNAEELVYFVFGKIQDGYNKTEKNTYNLVYLDKNNNTFSIYPLEKIEYANYVANGINNKKEKIALNEYNKFKITLVNEQTIIETIFDYLKENIFDDSDYIYECLDENYKKIRFGNLDNFESYVQKNKEFFSNIIAESYLVNNYDNYTEYVVKDQYGNIYVFDEKAVLDYTIKLDTYTLDSDKFNNTYKTATNKDKVLMNLDKFFQMLNANDYKSAYAVLDDKFKATYFKTEESFENFVKQYMYVHANTKYMNYSDKVSGVYTYYVELTNKENENDKVIGMNVVMQLQEGTNFKISFEIVR